MRLTAMFSFVAVVYAGSASIGAQQPRNGAPPASPFANRFEPKSRRVSPPRFLFPTPTPRLNSPSGARSASTPTIVCGLTLIPADPNVDPGIRQEVPKDGPKFLLRPVDPKVCRQP